MKIQDRLNNPVSVTNVLEDYYGEEIQYSPIHNNPRYHLTPNELIALQTQQLTAYKRYGFLRGVRSGKVYAKVESITLDQLLELDMNNNIPLGRLLSPYRYTRENIYAKLVNEQDEAGNSIVFRITARLSVDRPVSLVKEWIYGQEN